MAKESKYGEKTKMVNYRIPESKILEINQVVKLKLNEYEKNALIGSGKKMNPADIVFKNASILEIESFSDNPTDYQLKKIEPQVDEYIIEYELLDSFPLGIEKIDDFGKNKILYCYGLDYYTRLLNEKAKHVSYESAVNYLKSK
jgi:hypothetical protein